MKKGGFLSIQKNPRDMNSKPSSTPSSLSNSGNSPWASLLGSFFFFFWLCWVFERAFSSCREQGLRRCPEACEILVPWSEIEPMSPANSILLDHQGSPGGSSYLQPSVTLRLLSYEYSTFLLSHLQVFMVNCLSLRMCMDEPSHTLSHHHFGMQLLGPSY